MLNTFTFTTTWHHIEYLMPLRNRFVLVKTTYSRCKFGAAFFNGTDWIGVDFESNILNVEYWCEIEVIEG